MAGEQTQGLVKQGFSRFRTMPGRCAGWMRKGNHILPSSVVLEFPLPADDRRKALEREELGDCEPAHRENEERLKKLKFPFEPVGASGNFIVAWHSVSPIWVLAREAPAYRREIYPVPSLLLVPPERPLDPAEKRLSGGPCEGTAKLRFLDAWSLPDEDDSAGDRSASDHRLLHRRASFAATQKAEVGPKIAHVQPKRRDAIL